jgi:hypothetical protein
MALLTVNGGTLRVLELTGQLDSLSAQGLPGAGPTDTRERAWREGAGL